MRLESFRAVEQRSLCGTEPAVGAEDDGDGSFVDVVGGEQGGEGEESQGFTFNDKLMRATLLSETVLEGDAGSSELPLC